MPAEPTNPSDESGLFIEFPTTAELGYRMPAEWEPHECIWLTTPHNPDTWPGCLDKAQAQYDNWMQEMSRFVRVRTTQSLGIKTNDSWIRDYGPIFVVDDRGGLGCHSFRFNAWGRKYDPWDKDNSVPHKIAAHLNVPLWRHDMVLEGGSIGVNGRGTLLTTESCLLHHNRNPKLTRNQIEQQLHATLGTTHVIWMAGGLEGDDTDGHMDDIARFVTPDTLLAVRAPAGHRDHDILEKDWEILTNSRDQDGQPLNLVPLPVPEPITYDFPPNKQIERGTYHLPASYANFLTSNGAVFVPVFGQPADDQALKIIDNATPGLTVIPIRAEWIVVGRGALHCLSQQQPAVALDTE